MDDADEQLPSLDPAEGKASIGSGPQGIDLPPNVHMLREARALAGDRDVRINQLATVVGSDPVLTLEMLKSANATYYASNKAPVTNIRSAIIRLGSGTIIEIFERLMLRPQLSPQTVAIQFEVLRALSTEVANVAFTIASIAARDLTEQAHTAGLLSYTGHLIACAYLGERYTEISSSRQVASLSYKLHQDYHFDVRSVQLAYLRLRGVPQELFFGLDRDLQCKTTAQANLRFTVQGAMEMVEAVHGGRWEKYEPGQHLPTKSALRLLKMQDHQYEEIYEGVSALLKTHIEPTHPAAPVAAAAAKRSAATAVGIVRMPVVEIDAPLPNANFKAALAETNFITQSDDELEEDANGLSDDGKKVIGLIQEIARGCRSTQELLANVMNLLITDGPYARAALLLLGAERQSATVHTAVGETIAHDPLITVEDPLSPLALCLTKINSFNAQGLEDHLSPFGITSYAVSPIRMKNMDRVVLYADCGVERSLPMEARKVFRLVVGLLNQILPSLPGGLPKQNFKGEKNTVKPTTAPAKTAKMPVQTGPF